MKFVGRMFQIFVARLRTLNGYSFKPGFHIVVPVARIVSVAWKELPVVRKRQERLKRFLRLLVSIKSFLSYQMAEKPGTSHLLPPTQNKMAAVNRRRRLLACYVLLKKKGERKSKETSVLGSTNLSEPRRERLGIFHTLVQEMKIRRFSRSSVFIIFTKFVFVVETLIALYFFHKRWGTSRVTRVGSGHFEQRNKQQFHHGIWPIASVARIVWTGFH